MISGSDFTMVTFAIYSRVGVLVARSYSTTKISCAVLSISCSVFG